jgi:hypothetical protein
VSDDTKLMSIDTLAGQFRESAELQRYCDQQYVTIQRLQQENTALRAELLHVRDLLSSTTELVPKNQDPVRIEVTPEQAICEIQISKIQEKAQVRELSLEETKRLEILIKALYLIKESEKQEIVPDFVKLPPGTNVLSLEQIAASPEPQPESD